MSLRDLPQESGLSMGGLYLRKPNPGCGIERLAVVMHHQPAIALQPRMGALHHPALLLVSGSAPAAEGQA